MTAAGGTVTPYGFRKGDWLEATKAGKTAHAYISDYTKRVAQHIEVRRLWGDFGRINKHGEWGEHFGKH